MQTPVLVVSLLGMLLVSAAFILVIRNSSVRQDNYAGIVTRGYSVRRWWMIALCVVGVTVTITSLTPFPITANAGTPPKVIKAVGGQWYWKLDNNTAMAGEPVQFHVTSDDVNHGFAIYNPDNKIIAQTQAMPGYVNQLNVTFTEPGLHRILCLEYCGLAHHGMIADFTVTEAN